ncbi:helix-turn-helix domain-containing protein [Patescibacteria group bacterium]|nr:helix-turn-helix domain-containing protein [Patescibacteria group bacterium]MBU1683116.1 helix-turn-helix domain-containing protein [Patescibacteria group bacterium]MBU1934759.1 helix-turn-helix domain-containing protein [Patescibacteria group bacterium]
MSNTYVDREEASQILKVSTRTIDRYVRKYRFKTRKNGRRVLIRRVDVDKIIEDHIGQFVDIKSTNFDINLDNKSDDNDVSNVSNFKVKNLKVESIKKSGESDESDEKVYKTLYGEVKKELKERQERLEAATYRVGQLETQVKSMVPLLDYNRKEKELKEANLAIEQKALEGEQAIKKMENKLKAERIAKWIYLSLVGLLLVAEPILFLFWAFS